MDRIKAEAAAEEILKAFSKAQAIQYAKKFAEIFDNIDPSLVVELSEEVAKIMKDHSISDAGYDGAVAESALMWIRYQQHSHNRQ